MRPSLRKAVARLRPRFDLGRMPVEARYAYLDGVAVLGTQPIDGVCMHTPRGCLILVAADDTNPIGTLLHELVHAEQIHLGLKTTHDARFWARLSEVSHDP